MFESEDEALSFRDEIITALDETETDGWHVSPTLDGVNVRLGGAVARARGHLDGQGYRVRERDVDPEKDGNWPVAKLDVRPR